MRHTAQVALHRRREKKKAAKSKSADCGCPKANQPPTPAEIEARLEAEGYDPKRDMKSGCECDPPME